MLRKYKFYTRKSCLSYSLTNFSEFQQIYYDIYTVKCDKIMKFNIKYTYHPYVLRVIWAWIAL